MDDMKAPDYWASLLAQIRNLKGWTQAELAEELGVTRETISRWEQEAKYPSAEMQEKVGRLASTLNVASVFGIGQVVEVSPFPMILTDRNDFVIAASKSSGFMKGKTVLEQMPPEEQTNYQSFSKMVSDTGFWEKSGNTFEYEYKIGNETRRAVIQSVGSRGHIFALVQKL